MGMTLMVDVYTKEVGILLDEVRLYNCGRRLIEITGTHYAGLSCSGTFPNILYPHIKGGVSVLLLLAESHFSVHTFPENDRAHIEISSCKDFNYGPVLNYIEMIFKPYKTKVANIAWGEEERDESGNGTGRKDESGDKGERGKD